MLHRDPACKADAPPQIGIRALSLVLVAGVAMPWLVVPTRCCSQGSFVRSLNKFHGSRYGTSLRESDYFSYHFADVWGCSDEEVRFDNCRRSSLIRLPSLDQAALCRLCAGEGLLSECNWANANEAGDVTIAFQCRRHLHA